MDTKITQQRHSQTDPSEPSASAVQREWTEWKSPKLIYLAIDASAQNSITGGDGGQGFFDGS